MTAADRRPWGGDACSLVDAFRRGERSPFEEPEATLAAIGSSDLNAFCFLDESSARAVARDADVSLPFGGVPIGVKGLDQVEGWPDTEASVPLAASPGSWASRARSDASPMGRACSTAT
jgi:aspartyl-tRNA(Asn)/glutamyl-tRNA(Gln) amidotransferase subunit A